ncbi:MAG TPA: histidine kinase N-terminal domain-containing protein [Propioniciclava sp.]|jgi:two-component sensor histidine kinase|uniref:sensor histidine kinase n=1 Tax=Propioniciclava sp. TaxID=2038686 RepID=UPI002C335C27|nr:histidine kinase N-terminal domain-containing protein [Propioniciclava sp.]HRL50028.1 histidine kinase N-terminal domain-containing protein [Propioniciclava sp.]HRL80169.1 histidine kinase N-terminal domain-containing protein [Propioniciclava sp.]
MLSMTEVIAAHTALSEDDTRWLVGLVDQWGMLSDLSFSDLILWVPDEDDNVFWAAAQCRPTTGPTALEDDVVGEEIAYDPESLVIEAYLSQEICATSGNKLHAGIPVDVHAVPVLRDERAIAVVELHTNRMGVRAPGALEDAYLETATLIMHMVSLCQFPTPGDKPVPWGTPRVGDGSLLVNTDGMVTFASPNAMSAFRRLGWGGDVLGDRLPTILTSFSHGRREPVEEVAPPLLAQHRVRETELETVAGAMRIRSQPLWRDGDPAGWFVTCRDVTDLRTRERELVTKDATIREIHHRVKNNLQTVAALLRLQARRSSSEEASNALADAQKRVAAIAVVHEILSQGFDTSVSFDEVADRLMTMVRDVATTRNKVTMSRIGSFGNIPADVATNLSLVFTEVVQNALEHGLGDRPGHVVVTAGQNDGFLNVDVVNDGASLAPDFELGSAQSLGLSIVITLVADLHGTFDIEPGPGGVGTSARIAIPLD